MKLTEAYLRRVMMGDYPFTYEIYYELIKNRLCYERLEKQIEHIKIQPKIDRDYETNCELYTLQKILDGNE